MESVSAIVLAAGKGTRMKSHKPKVLLELLGRPLLYWTLDLLESLNIQDIVVVTGYKAGIVQETVARHFSNRIKFAHQNKQKGTAHAVEVGLSKIDPNSRDVLILYGDDSALYKPDSLKKFINFYRKNAFRSGAVLTSTMAEPTSIGGLEVSKDANVIGVLTKDQLIQRRVLPVPVACGAFVFNRRVLEDNINKIPASSKSGEFGLPGIIKVLASQENYLKAYALDDERQWHSINTPEELSLAERKKRQQK